MYVSGRLCCTVVIVNHTLVPLEVWSCIYSLSDNDYHYFSQLEATNEGTWLVKMIRNDWFGRKHEVVSSRTVDPWFERGLPAVYQLPKVLKILKSDQSTKITLSIYLSSSLSWVSPLVTINSFEKSPKISKFSDQKILRPFKNPQKNTKNCQKWLEKCQSSGAKSFIFTQKPLFFKNFLSIFRDTLVRWVGCKGVTVSCANRDNIENGFVLNILKQIQKKVLRYKVHFKLSCKPIWRLSEFLMVNFLHNYSSSF